MKKKYQQQQQKKIEFTQNKLLLGHNDEILSSKYISKSREYVALATNSADLKIIRLGSFDCSIYPAHKDIIMSLAVSADGQLLATGSKDNTIKIWFVGLLPSSRQLQRRLKKQQRRANSSTQSVHKEDDNQVILLGTCVGHTDSVSALCFGPKHSKFLMQDETKKHKKHSKPDDVTLSRSSLLDYLKSLDRNIVFASAGSDHTLKLWDIYALIHNFCALSEQGKATHTLTAPTLCTLQAHPKADINTIDIAPNDKLIATGSHDRSIKIFQMVSHKLLPLPAPVSSSAANSFSSSALQMTQRASLVVAKTLKAHRRAVWRVRFSPVDQVIVSCSGDKTIKIWSLSDYALLKTFQGHANSVLDVHFLCHGMQLLSAGSDGLVKLWTIKTNECVSTFDGHDDKIWDMDVHPKELQFVSGGASSQFNVWVDRTSDLLQQEALEGGQRLLDEQELANSLQQRQYQKAVLLALRLERPHKLLHVFNQLVAAEQDRADASIREIVQSLCQAPKQRSSFVKLLHYITAWNANSKHALLAQRLLYAVMSCISPDKLLQIVSVVLDEAKKQNHDDNDDSHVDVLISGDYQPTPQAVTQLQKTIESLIPFSEKHYNRLNALYRKSFLLDLMITNMQSYLPQQQNDLLTSTKQQKTTSSKQQKTTSSKQSSKQRRSKRQKDTTTKQQRRSKRQKT